MSLKVLPELGAANRSRQKQLSSDLEAALRSLPAGATMPGGIPYRDLIPGIARHLTIMAKADPRTWGPAALDHEIDCAVSTLRKLFLSRLLGGAPLEPGRLPEAPPGIGAAAMTLLPLPLRLRFIELAAEAGALARDIDAARPVRRAGAKGRRKKSASRAIASFLFQETERLTGSTPGRSVAESDGAIREGGEFVNLVRKVFDILKVKGSPERAARAAIEEEGRKAKRHPMTRNQE